MLAVATPADKLEGVTLSSGWKIGERFIKKNGESGGNFGTCYFATRGEDKAFIKALDFRRAYIEADFISALNQLTGHVLWEKELMEFCSSQGMSRIVRLLDYEDLVLPEDHGDQTKKICCLVFEVGKGDLRRHFDLTSAPRKSWRLRVLRDVALALDQLHRRGVAHLDVKPSNVILVGELLGKAEMMKLGDLGRCVRKGMNGPFDAMIWPGDQTYAPPEKWYGYKSAQWNDEREAGDAYLLGSLAVFLFSGVAMNPLLVNEIPDSFRPAVYRGAFDEQLIDVLKQAQAKAIALHVVPELPACSREELISTITELTAPDPSKRGDRRARLQGVVGIDRYHQKFLRIAERVSLEERKGTV